MLLQRLHDRTARIVVLGQGYVGLVLAMRATEAGFRVVGLDTDRQRTQLLAAGQSFIEDVPDSVLKAALAAGYRPTSDPDALGDFDVAVISVPTPLREGGPDLSFIEAAAEMLAPRLKQDCLVVLESTTYPGTTEELVAPILEAGSAEGLLAGNGFFLGYSPERIDPGNPSFGLENTPKIVAGIDEASLQVTRAFFDAFVSKTVPVSGCGTAELAKVIENTFRHVNIALVNEIAMFAHDLGIDVSEAIDAAATKPFGFMRFTPGPGVGGHCLPIDPTYLSWRVKQHLGESFRFIELANDINEHMPHYVVRRVTAALNRDKKAVNGSTIVLLGLSYKPNVADIREAPSLPIIEQLHAQGAMVSTVDPFVDTCSAAGATHHRQIDLDLLERADLVVIVTDHDQFDYDAVVQRSRRILDTRGRLSESRAEGVERL
ncbi:MAG: nucleotide sugar dehydrogenase [Acidimicrobiales bacterium]